MGRAISVSQLLLSKKKVFAFQDQWAGAFGKPEKVGVWFVWGNSGNGKTRFTLQLCKYLTAFGRVAYNSLEEGDSLSMQNAVRDLGVDGIKRRMIWLCEPVHELTERLKKRKSPDIIVIDSFQYFGLNYAQYKQFKEQHRDTLIIFLSHADGKHPAGRAATSVRYDASLKIWIEGYRAFSQGRFKGDQDYFTIWKKGAEDYWGTI